jgi:hypothetical protein
MGIIQCFWGGCGFSLNDSELEFNIKEVQLLYYFLHFVIYLLMIDKYCRPAFIEILFFLSQFVVHIA